MLPTVMLVLLVGLAPALRWQIRVGHVTAGAFAGEIGCRSGLHGSISRSEREWDLCIGKWHWAVVIE
jgi:hypothetical protein